MARRILLFCHDATGLGHLRRISRIALALQRSFSCLVVTGMNEASWLVTPPCQYVKLPNWDCLVPRRAQSRNIPMWLEGATGQALELRSSLLLSVSSAFRPDAIMVDYLPFGLQDELKPLLATTGALKYLIHRGICDRSDADVLTGSVTDDISAYYDRVIVTADRRLVDVATEYSFARALAEKVLYVGFVRPVPNRSDSTSNDSGQRQRPLIVCGCGGGLGGETVFRAAIDAARCIPNSQFEIVVGPHGKLLSFGEGVLPDNCQVHTVCNDLDYLHSKASVVITHGGYNSVTEAIHGQARILVCHIQGDDHNERIEFERRLSRVYPIRSINNLTTLHQEILYELHALKSAACPVFPWSFDGLEGLKTVLEEDLGARTPDCGSPRCHPSAERV